MSFRNCNCYTLGFDYINLSSILIDPILMEKKSIFKLEDIFKVYSFQHQLKLSLLFNPIFSFLVLFFYFYIFKVSCFHHSFPLINIFILFFNRIFAFFFFLFVFVSIILSFLHHNLSYFVTAFVFSCYY